MIHRTHLAYKRGTWGWRVQGGDLWMFYWCFCDALRAERAWGDPRGAESN